MKYLIFFLLTAAAYAQPDVNALDEIAFEAIEIDGQTIDQIKATRLQGYKVTPAPSSST